MGGGPQPIGQNGKTMDQGHFLEDATPEFRAKLADKASGLTLAAGQTLFEQQDFDDRLYVLDDGLLEVSVLAPNGRRLALNQLQPGSVFGEIAIFDPGPRTATITALRPSRLRAIRQGTLIRLIRDDPALFPDLLRLAGQRMRWMSQQMEDQVFMPPAARLAGRLLQLAGDGDEIAMSQAQLADYVGVTRELVSKTLSDWRREDLVALSRGKIRILDAESLEDMRDSVFL
jgi:CRP-like cAMP-binding protein